MSKLKNRKFNSNYDKKIPSFLMLYEATFFMQIKNNKYMNKLTRVTVVQTHFFSFTINIINDRSFSFQIINT